MPKNVGDLGKLIVAKDFKKLPKLQKIAQSGHPVSTTLNVLITIVNCLLDWPQIDTHER